MRVARIVVALVFASVVALASPAAALPIFGPASLSADDGFLDGFSVDDTVPGEWTLLTPAFHVEDFSFDSPGSLSFLLPIAGGATGAFIHRVGYDFEALFAGGGSALAALSLLDSTGTVLMTASDLAGSFILPVPLHELFLTATLTISDGGESGLDGSASIAATHITAAPEPSTLTLIGAGFAAAVRRRRRR